jgi:hypothetical protein
MLPRLDAAGTAPLTPVGRAEPAAAIGDAHQEAFQRSLRTMLGQTLRGEVLARQADGSFLVRVAGTAARMMLPSGARVGSEVPLTLLAIDPRPTFQVGAGERHASAVTVALAYADAGPKPDTAVTVALGHTEAQAEAELAAGAQPRVAAGASLAANLLGKAPLTPAALLPGFDPSAPPPELSKAARAIAGALNRAESGPATPTAIIGKTPLMAEPAQTGTTQLARTLQETVAHSGLFYESHVAEWAAGQRALPELLKEPQMRAAPELAAQMQRAAEAEAGPNLASAQLINLQLHAQEQARIVWQGEAWPGQNMEWEIERDAQGGEDTDEAPSRQWRSTVRFEFPGLGTVSAALLLIDGALQIQLQAGSKQSAGALRSHAGTLERALAAAGAPLTALSISGQDGD